MFREIRVPIEKELTDINIIKDTLGPSKPIEYKTYYVFEEEKPKSLPPKDFEVLIPFLGSPKKVKFKCPKCDKEFITMANGSKDKTYVECDIKFCSNCGQEFDWRV